MLHGSGETVCCAIASECYTCQWSTCQRVGLVSSGVNLPRVRLMAIAAAIVVAAVMCKFCLLGRRAEQAGQPVRSDDVDSSPLAALPSPGAIPTSAVLVGGTTDVAATAPLSVAELVDQGQGAMARKAFDKACVLFQEALAGLPFTSPLGSFWPRVAGYGFHATVNLSRVFRLTCPQGSGVNARSAPCFLAKVRNV